MIQKNLLFEEMKKAAINGERDLVKKYIQEGLDQNYTALEIIESLVPAMDVVGNKFASGEFYLPQMMIAARAMSEGIEMLKPLLLPGQTITKAKAIFGTVKGDYHDIGKNIVKIILESGGYEVIDLGVDVAPERFVEASKKEKPRFVLMSALLTLTMPMMDKTIKALGEAGIRDAVKIGVGGAPVTQKFADHIGADFYADDAPGALKKCNGLL